MLPPHRKLIEPSLKPANPNAYARHSGPAPRRPARPGRPPMMRPPLPYRVLSLASWYALLANKAAAS